MIKGNYMCHFLFFFFKATNLTLKTQEAAGLLRVCPAVTEN